MPWPGNQLEETKNINVSEWLHQFFQSFLEAIKSLTVHPFLFCIYNQAYKSFKFMASRNCYIKVNTKCLKQPQKLFFKTNLKILQRSPSGEELNFKTICRHIKQNLITHSTLLHVFFNCFKWSVCKPHFSGFFCIKPHFSS